MHYKEFNNIEIMTDMGVSDVRETTFLLAREAKKLDFNNAVDVGTGTGFIPIFLNTCGKKCDGIDINSKSIICAKKNAELNKVNIDFYVSNLFEKTNKKFDLILFNPPYGNTDSDFMLKHMENFKSLFPKDSKLLAKLSYPLIKGSRKKLLEKFLFESKNILSENGIILFLCHTLELSILHGIEYSVLGQFDKEKLVKIG